VTPLITKDGPSSSFIWSWGGGRGGAFNLNRLTPVITQPSNLSPGIGVSEIESRAGS